MFRKILFILICLFFLAAPVDATDYFLDMDHTQGDGSGGDGTTMQTDGGADDAFSTFAEAYASIGTTDVCWIRRVQNQIQAADIAPTQDGTAAAPAIWIGWPRDADSWDCDWVNGSTTVDNIDENDAARSTHQGRWITGPDGFDYLITDITDTNTVIIDRPFAGTTAANEVCAIKADELPRGVSEPADTDNWSADGDDLALVDFNDGNFNVNMGNDEYLQFWNIEFKDSDDLMGVFYANNSDLTLCNGCLFSQSTKNDLVAQIRDGTAVFNRCIFEGFGGDNFNVEVEFEFSSVSVTNSAVYNMGDHGILMLSGSYLYLENVNIGEEVANFDDDINTSEARVVGRDVKLGGTNGTVVVTDTEPGKFAGFISTNNNKVLSAWKAWYAGGTVEKVAVTGVTPNKKLSDNVIEVTPATANTYQHTEIELKARIYESRKTYDAGTYNIKIWIYNDTGNILNDTTFSDDIMMRCRAEAGNYGDATTEYVSMPWTNSDEIDIADAADADDWDYLQCDSVVVDTNDSKIYCEVLVSTSDAQADNIFIDPQTANP
jgi:hypothetical protein